MHLSGRHTAQAAISSIWQVLMDVSSLARIIPGISNLEHAGQNNYKALFEVKLGPYNTIFSGNLNLDEIEVEKSFTLLAQLSSKIGSANATLKIELSGLSENNTEIHFNGYARLSGLMATMGNRLVGSTSNSLTKQFFSNLERELARHSGQDRA
jgi:uncharacterized protein